jgi:four helix bundle protein
MQENDYHYKRVPLPHERLIVYKLAVELVQLVANITKRRGHANLFDQVRRSSTSGALNISEGCGKKGEDRKRFFLIARGSVLETMSGLELMHIYKVIPSKVWQAGRKLGHQIYAMLTGLIKKD